MPCLESGHFAMDDYFTPEGLTAQLKAGHELPLLDCRSQCEFARRHIIGAINITMPALLQKRLKTGTLNVLGIIHNNDAKKRFKRYWKTHKVVLYDDCSTDLNENPSSFLNLLLEKLRQEGCSACYLLGGFSTFEQRYPELSAFLDSETDSTIIGLRNLSLSEDISDCDSENSPSDISPLPVEGAQRKLIVACVLSVILSFLIASLPPLSRSHSLLCSFLSSSFPATTFLLIFFLLFVLSFIILCISLKFF
ncbi:DUSP [Acanthosepion pharaonis]|uniref:DUSP n=1 Tax=Acanthosepion pharaonis TaxID=158019 RepID=A0A812CGT7_ACAPH|nr:DUSP [Sepia pharaonis]